MIAGGQGIRDLLIGVTRTMLIRPNRQCRITVCRVFHLLFTVHMQLVTQHSFFINTLIRALKKPFDQDFSQWWPLLSTDLSDHMVTLV